MVERRVLLIVFSISSILVLAGFSLNEKAYASVEHPPFGDFLCWFEESFEIAPNTLLTIEDQFGILDQNDLQAIFDGEDWEWIQYCTAVDKEIGEEVFLSPFSGLDQHYSGWSYPHDEEQATIGPGSNVTVIVDVPQFDQTFTTKLGFIDQIFVPANKTLPGENGGTVVDSVDLDHHWNCYEMFGPSPGVEVNLVTQHGNVTGTVGDPFLFCAPMQKRDAGETLFGNFQIQEHMVCYSLDEFDDSDIPNPLHRI